MEHNQLIKWKKKGGLYIASSIYKDWLVRVPVVRHRLHRDGTLGLSIPEKFDLKTKKGVLLIDSTMKAYVFIGNEVMNKYVPEMKDYNGVKNSLTVYPAKKMIEENNLPLVKIPNEVDRVEKYTTGVAGDVRKKFGI